MQWRRRDETSAVEVDLVTSGSETGIRIVRDTDPNLNAAEDEPYKPMDIVDDSLISFYGEVRRTVNGASVAEFKNLKAHLKLDEDVGSGGTELKKAKTSRLG